MLLPLELIARLSLSRRVQWTTDQRLATPRKIPPRDKIDPQGTGVPADPASLRRRGRLPRVRLRQLAAVRLDRGSEEGTDGVSDDSSSALPDAAVEVSHEGVGFGTAAAPATADTFLWGDELNEREDRRTLPRPRRSYPLSFWPQSISFLFSPTDLIIPKQKETRNCSSIEINEYTLL